MQENWPTKGDKLTFLTADGFHYPCFTNIIDFAKNNLSCGREYTVKKCEVCGSWCGVWLEEVEYEYPFHLSMFEWGEPKQLTKETLEKVKKLFNIP
ncbi:MAG: hypothetical protein FMNOHCHN_02054 [Ignavibacteriaceae bacterium]|nr:hypothetical protein [Ignavibacteriaceae bacterium]